MSDQRVMLGGIGVCPFGSDAELLDYVDHRKGILVAVNAEKIMNADDRLRAIINDNIGYCDGAGAVKGLKRKGAKRVVRIPGCELWLKIIARHYKDGRFYFVGSTDEVVAGVVEKLRREFEGIDIVGWRNGFIAGRQQREALIADIEAKSPDYVFVAMGSPRQEYLMAEMQQRHAAVYQGLGGSFDLYMGNFKRAPRLLQRVGCEWVWRFVAQPTRIKRIGTYLRFARRLYTGKL
ncbi:MAG: WecB/TagA/CpsF family glycosyltransferase [Alistipes sp.]|nr:WecB/TagA/CpsF family glycosyltransferase [Alistipes sp.]